MSRNGCGAQRPPCDDAGCGRPARRRRAVPRSLRGAVTWTGESRPRGDRRRAAAATACSAAGAPASLRERRRSRREQRRARARPTPPRALSLRRSSTLAQLGLLARARGSRAPGRPARSSRRAVGDLGLAVAHDRDQPRALGQLQALDALAGARASPCRSAPRRSRGSPCAARSRWTSSCSGTSCSISAMIDAVARDGRRDPEQVEVRLVARVVHARDHLLDAVLLARDLADHDVVLVVAGDRETMSGGRAMPARSSTKISVASPCCTWCSNSSSSRS